MVEYAQTADGRNAFTATRGEGRKAFGDLFDSAGWHARTLEHPGAQGPGGDPVTMEIGWIGPRDASNVLMSMSGTHGLEAFAGSAAQLGFARQLAGKTLPRDTALFFIHGYNGYGWAHASRSNESNVDLNRNMVDFTGPLPQNPLYDEAVHDLFAPARVESDPTSQMTAGIKSLSQRHGWDAVMDAINRGQYSRADGVYHGGSKREWSSATLLRLIREYLRAAKRVAFIDWHTGMGAFGETFFICFHDPRHPKFAQACQFWGREHLLDESGFAEAARPSYQGLVINAVEREIESLGAQMIGTVVEFGTYEPERVEAGIMIDRALRFDSDLARGSRATQLREQMQDTFNPDSQRWRDSVAARSSEIYESTLRGLTE
jgi:hypothetical protein